MKATRVDAWPPERAGEFCYFSNYEETDDHAGIVYCCPCGCGALGALSFDTHKSDHPRWHWDGNCESPTLTPSIQRTAGCRWHGYLTKGEFRPA